MFLLFWVLFEGVYTQKGWCCYRWGDMMLDEVVKQSFGNGFIKANCSW